MTSTMNASSVPARRDDTVALAAILFRTLTNSEQPQLDQELAHAEALLVR